MLCLAAQSCQTLCDRMDCSPPGSSVDGNSPGNTGVGCHILLQGIVPTQGSNPGLLHHRWILYHLSHQRSSLCNKHSENLCGRKKMTGCLVVSEWLSTCHIVQRRFTPVLGSAPAHFNLSFPGNFLKIASWSLY